MKEKKKDFEETKVEQELELHEKKKNKKERIEDVEIEKPETKSKTDKAIEEELKKESKKETLIPLEDYVKYAAHLGTKVITPHMRAFVYRRRADGLAVLNTNIIDDKIKDAVEFMKKYSPDEIFLTCKREAGWPAVEKFSEVTGIKAFTKKYPAGIITNLELENFFEKELIIICDPWLDKNALNDANKVKRPVISLCDANNLTTGVTKIIPCNNKSRKSIGLILWILAREYCKARKMPFSAKLEDFAGPAEETSE